MSTITHISIAERLGRWLGRGWRVCAHGERRVAAWLASQGLPVTVIAALLWTAKLVALGLMLYGAFWVTILLLGMIVAGCVANSSDEDEWLFTDITELRKTPGYDPNLYNDTSHELYTDD